MTYGYDCLGCVIEVRSPMNGSATVSLRHFYYTSGRPGYHNFARYHYHNWTYYDHTAYRGDQMRHDRPYSITEHYDDNGRLTTRTVVITDGFGRVLQTKKGLTNGNVPSMQVSGRAKVDRFGRATRQYDPFAVADTALASLGRFEPYTDSSATVTAYDILDRATKVRRPLGVTTLTYYDIRNDYGGRRRFFTKVTDPNGNVTKQYSDYDGHRVQATDANNGITLMHYDNLGQLVFTSDPEGFTTNYTYDMLGRMTKRIHPDAGTTRYAYDNAGNLLTETNPLGQINYDYTYYRVTKKRYSNMTGNDVTYTYGTSGTETGRPVRVVDGSGMYECKYDKLGNVVDETRTLAMPHHGEVYRFRMLYHYDSWGRMLAMTYPDGEKIKYKYQWGGDLCAMEGDKDGDARTYITQICYNRYGQRNYVEYGNSTRAHYAYDALHRLVRLRNHEQGGSLMQDIDYTFDNASNVTKIASNAGVVNTLGGAYRNTYEYDALHKLVGAQGGGAAGSYGAALAYSKAGRLERKSRVGSPTALSASVDMACGYCDKCQPHAVKRMYDYGNGMLYDMRWDGAGNLGQVSVAKAGDKFEAGRFLFWTEDSRMHAAARGG